MKHTELIEFQNRDNELLRGILVNQRNDRLVLMCGGFERRTTTEPKFKKLADLLAEAGISSFRFDYSGCGLSDGDFSKTTVKRMAAELLLAVEAVKEKHTTKSLAVVAHSLSACVVAYLAEKKLFEKIIFLAPALNQKELLRYWFTKTDSDKEVSWTDYRQFMDEERFDDDCKRKNRATKSNVISSEYFLENKEKDYSDALSDTENILHIHGGKDDDVPLESVTVNFLNRLIVEEANHDLEKNNVFKTWSEEVLNFIR